MAEKSYIEVQSDLFRGSGNNASTDENKIGRFVKSMLRSRDWGRFPPVEGNVSEVDEDDLEDYNEALENGYEYELDWSRPLTEDDIGTEYVHLIDGHNRAFAASSLGIPIRVKIHKAKLVKVPWRRTAYHATSISKLESISQNGLVPQPSVDSAGLHRPPLIWLSSKIQQAEVWAEQIIGWHSEESVILRVRLSDTAETYDDPNQRGTGVDFVTTELIPPNRIEISVGVDEYGKHLWEDLAE